VKGKKHDDQCGYCGSVSPVLGVGAAISTRRQYTLKVRRMGLRSTSSRESEGLAEPFFSKNGEMLV